MEHLGAYVQHRSLEVRKDVRKVAISAHCTQAEGSQRQGVITKRLGVSLGGDENIINLIVVITAQLNLLKPTGLYTLNGQILEYYIFVKLLFEKL